MLTNNQLLLKIADAISQGQSLNISPSRIGEVQIREEVIRIRVDDATDSCWFSIRIAPAV